MKFNEHVAKALVIGPAGLALPRGQVIDTPEAAYRAFEKLGPCVIKAQVPTGGRGKAGGVRIARSAEDIQKHAEAILGMSIDGHVASQALVEELVPVVRELYVAILPDPESRAPMVLFSARGGMDVEEITSTDPGALRRNIVRVGEGFGDQEARAMLAGLDLGRAEAAVADSLVRLYAAFRETDAELIEINPLGVTVDHRVIALDCKYVLDEAAGYRQPSLAAAAVSEPATELENAAKLAGLKYIEMDGKVGVLANGAGLTMATMDVITFLGGRPANFLEIGGEAYTKAEQALALVLANPRIKSLVINFCGAYARTDVMAAGLVKAWQSLNPTIPSFFSIRGTGEEEAIELVRSELGIQPFARMEDAIAAAVEAAS